MFAHLLVVMSYARICGGKNAYAHQKASGRERRGNRDAQLVSRRSAECHAGRRAIADRFRFRGVPNRVGTVRIIPACRTLG